MRGFLNFGRLFFLLVVVAFCGAACTGYRLGAIRREGVNTIALDRVNNLTDQPRLAFDAAAKISSQLVRDGTVRLVDEKDADAVLKVRVLSYTVGSAGAARLASTDTDQETYTTLVWRITVKMEYSLVKPGQKDPLVSSRVVSGSAEISDLYDVETARQDGFRQAIHEAAKKIVIGITEDW